MSALRAAADIDLGALGEWREPERIVVDVDTSHRGFDPTHEPLDVIGQLRAMAEYRP